MMLRRRHRKSRRGCFECKQRHIKCDENQPRCHLCTISERECSYTSQPSPGSISVDGKSPAYLSSIASESLSDDQNEARETAPNLPLVTAVSPPNLDSQGRQRNDRSQHPSLNEDVNINQMELLIHVSLSSSIGWLVPGLGPESTATSTALQLKACLGSPCLLYETLAVSARHLAFLHPHRAGFYLHQAVTLQTKGLSLFNTSETEINESNCIANLLFASTLGRHLLVDTLSKRDDAGLEDFLERYAQFAQLQLGMQSVARSSWPTLLESKLEPFLSLGARITRSPPRGSHCTRLRELIDGAEGMDADEKRVCREATRLLQVGFDIHEDVLKEGYSRYQMVFSWTVSVPKDFLGLLVQKRPAALVALAYYAVLLHYSRDIWYVGHAGPYIVGMIGDFLDPEWDHWLEWPRAEVACS